MNFSSLSREIFEGRDRKSLLTPNDYEPFCEPRDALNLRPSKLFCEHNEFMIGRGRQSLLDGKLKSSLRCDAGGEDGSAECDGELTRKCRLEYTIIMKLEKHSMAFYN